MKIGNCLTREPSWGVLEREDRPSLSMQAHSVSVTCAGGVADGWLN